ncbi:Ankyrin repeats (3 copies) [Gemmata sp. SH-PL17]|uniref:ankyrin repeat domain-containing protein n=1 Tax=Gemmata sp. SH-PL17 TaxID=1630693 RepID=UPI00078B2326|nr:ankyrin repeat domain-containing protein [Gemmata sp. SH-PL17]AMV27426.1 Ankyrin repeats (3 copies) [Gemmata sp. SH-PL17]
MATPARQMLEAVLAGDAATVADLLDVDPQLADLADRAPGRFSVLHLAARRGYLPVVELLLAAGAAVNRWSHDGSTPLHEAALGGHLEVARVLLAAGANTRATDNGGHSVLCAALVSGNPTLIEMLRACDQPGGSVYARGYFRGRPRVT